MNEFNDYTDRVTLFEDGAYRWHYDMDMYHRCSKCGKRMHKASRNEMVELSCPECGRKNQADEFWMWD